MTFYHLDPSRRGEQLATQLEKINDYRVLRRLPYPEEMWSRSMPVPENILRIAVVDCETTGLDPERHKMIELAIGTISIDLDHGDVVEITPPQSWLEDPGEDLSVEIERLTHITPYMLIGKSIPEDSVRQALSGVGVVVAHNAKFDRSFVTRRFAALTNMPWCCSMSQVDWPELGLSGGRSISALLPSAGFFLPDAHRAAADTWATTCLLASPAPDGRAIAAHLIDTARQPTQRLYAERAPFELKDALRAAGYHWSPERRAWWIEADPERIANERTWLCQVSGLIRPVIEGISWLNRYS